MSAAGRRRSTSTTQVRTIFDRHAQEFDAWFGENRKLYVSELNALKAAGPAGRILDLGVGSGVFASKLGAHLGVDVSRNILKLSRKRGLQVLQADVKYLPIRDGSFDSVVISFTICFVDDALAMLNEASRALGEKGRLILGEITRDSTWGRLYFDEGKRGHKFYSKARFFTARETLSTLAKSGFEAVRAFGTVRFAPTQKPRIERATQTDLRNPDDVRRYGFICILATKKKHQKGQTQL